MAPDKPASERELQPARKERAGFGPAFPLEGFTLRESKSGDGSLHLQGHAAVFDRLSSDVGGFHERIARGAFAGVLDGDPDVHLVMGHDMNRVLARTHSKTLELREDPAGLHVWASLDPDDADVRALVPKMRRGDVDQMSFAFTVPKGGDSWGFEGDGDDEIPVRTVNRVSGLYDVSVVAQGAYRQTDAQLRTRVLQDAIESGRLNREVAEQEVEPDDPADEQSEPQVDDLASDEQRTTAPDDPAAGDSSLEGEGESERVVKELQAHTRVELELAKRRLLEADRK